MAWGTRKTSSYGFHSLRRALMVLNKEGKKPACERKKNSLSRKPFLSPAPTACSENVTHKQMCDFNIQIFQFHFKAIRFVTPYFHFRFISLNFIKVLISWGPLSFNFSVMFSLLCKLLLKLRMKKSFLCLNSSCPEGFYLNRHLRWCLAADFSHRKSGSNTHILILSL